MKGVSAGKSTNELISLRKRKKLIRKAILFIIFSTSVLITLCLKLSYFNVSDVIIINNKNISKETIESLSGIERGNNIFYINTRKVKTNVLINPYIVSVNIKRRLPGTVILEVTERDAFYYTMKDNKFIVLDSSGRVLELRDKIDGMDLIRVDGLKYNSFQSGEVIQADDNRKINVLSQISDLAKRNKSGIKFTSLDVESLTNMTVFLSNMRVKVGNDDNLESKLNKAINIMNGSEAKNAKGYIDVSFEGNPVLFIER